jgi:hypothetical protein
MAPHSQWEVPCSLNVMAQIFIHQCVFDFNAFNRLLGIKVRIFYLLYFNSRRPTIAFFFFCVKTTLESHKFVNGYLPHFSNCKFQLKYA